MSEETTKFLMPESRHHRREIQRLVLVATDAARD
jgi:hypothetical protein